MLARSLCTLQSALGLAVKPMRRHRSLNLFCAKELSYNLAIVFSARWEETQNIEDAMNMLVFVVSANMI